eukprot:COSAG05_NODE_74_length_21769_cov_194.316290_17_plen_64_part_00
MLMPDPPLRTDRKRSMVMVPGVKTPLRITPSPQPREPPQPAPGMFRGSYLAKLVVVPTYVYIQ